MRGLRILIFLLLIGVAFFYFGQGGFVPSNSDVELEVERKEMSIDRKALPEKINAITGLAGTTYRWVGKDVSELKKQYGKPVRKDLSSYGYTWWVYTNKVNEFIQFGVDDSNKIVTVFATGDNLSTEPVAIGQSYEELAQQFEFKNEISLSKGITSYRFELTEEDTKTRPIMHIGEDEFVQFYFDKFTNKLSSIRVMNTNVLLLQRPYEIFYRGDIPEPPLLSDKESLQVDQGMEQQIFDITNIVRTRHNKSILHWEEEAAQVALGHSKDMEQNNYFSHYTQDGDGLKERLSTSEIFYFTAGENIAAQYTDGPAVVEGWLNSEGHREALLNDDYTHLGVGVYNYYYTQNFLQKLNPH